MKKRIAGTAAAVALAAACCMGAGAGAAFAADAQVDVWGAQSLVSSADRAAGQAELDVLDFSGEAGGTVYITLRDNGQAVVEYLPHTMGETTGSSTATDGHAADLFAMEVPLDAEKLDAGSYTVEVYAHRSDTEPIYSGAVYSVWADLVDAAGESAGSLLLGTRTVSTAGVGATFAAPQQLQVEADGAITAYALASEEPTTSGNVLRFTYNEYDPTATVDGVVTYVDKSGAVVAQATVPGLEQGADPVAFTIPSAVEGTDGKVYRTLSLVDTLQLRNPGATAFTVTVVEMSDDDTAAANHYVATIQMVDENGTVIASDTVDVKGTFVYTAPETIYKTLTVDGAPQVATYRATGDTVVKLSSADDRDLVQNHARTVQVPYATDSSDAGEAEVTFNLLDGSKDATAGAAGRVLGVKTATVSEENPTATPDATLDVNGTSYVLAGTPEQYAYEKGSGRVPVVDVYYVPSGYKAPGSYEVAVRYVNFANGNEIQRTAYTSDPDAANDLQVETPEQFVADGITWVRLPGQEEPLAHNYYSNISEYVVYYRDSSVKLSGGEVVQRVRVVYRDLPGATVILPTTDGGTTGAAGGAVAAGAGTGAGAAAAGAGQLNQAGTYNTVGGQTGNQGLVNQSGVDANTERIQEEENPLAATPEGADEQGEGTGSQGGLPVKGIVGGVIAAVVAALVAAGIVSRRRKQED